MRLGNHGIGGSIMQMDGGVIGLRQSKVRNGILEARLIEADQQGYKEQESLDGESWSFSP
jgi:hypothetical protein